MARISVPLKTLILFFECAREFPPRSNYFQYLYVTMEQSISSKFMFKSKFSHLVNMMFVGVW